MSEPAAALSAEEMAEVIADARTSLDRGMTSRVAVLYALALLQQTAALAESEQHAAHYAQMLLRCSGEREAAEEVARSQAAMLQRDRSRAEAAEQNAGDRLVELCAAEQRASALAARLAEVEAAATPRMDGTPADRLAWRVLALREAMEAALLEIDNMYARQLMQNALIVDDANAALAQPEGKRHGG